MPTREDVEKLKREWKYDPCWDLEITEGFEEYREELKQYSEKIQQENQQRWEETRKEQAAKYGVEYNSPLHRVIETFEHRLDQIEQSIEKLRDNIS